jgi:hypothetical protein
MRLPSVSTSRATNAVSSFAIGSVLNARDPIHGRR